MRRSPTGILECERWRFSRLPTGPEGRARAFFSAPPPTVVFCANRLHSAREVEETMVHELIHAYDVQWSDTRPRSLHDAGVYAAHSLDLFTVVHSAQHGHHQVRPLGVQVRRRIAQLMRRSIARTSTDGVVGMASSSSGSEIRSARESECFEKATLLASMLPDVAFFKNSSRWLHMRCVREHAIRSTKVRRSRPSCVRVDSGLTRWLQSMFPDEAQSEVDKMFTQCYADKSPFQR